MQKSQGRSRRFHLNNEKERRKVATEKIVYNKEGQPERGRSKTKKRYTKHRRARTSSPPPKYDNFQKRKAKICSYCYPAIINRYQRTHEAKLECKNYAQEFSGYNTY